MPRTPVPTGRHAAGAWYINSVNGHHRRLTNWIHRFKGVASSYLDHNLVWFKVLDRFGTAGIKPS